MQVEVEPLAIQIEQPPAPVHVRQGHLDSEVDSAGPGRECRFDHLGPVGREHEHDVGVLPEPVHLVQQLEQHRGRVAVLTILSDKIHILKHEHRWRQIARHLARGADCVQRGAGEEQDRAIRHQVRQVHRGQCLAGSRRAMQEQPALEMPSGCSQRFSMLGDRLGMPLDALEHTIGEHDLLTQHRG